MKIPTICERLQLLLQIKNANTTSKNTVQKWNVVPLERLPQNDPKRSLRP